MWTVKLKDIMDFGIGDFPRIYLKDVDGYSIKLSGKWMIENGIMYVQILEKRPKGLIFNRNGEKYRESWAHEGNIVLLKS